MPNRLEDFFFLIALIILSGFNTFYWKEEIRQVNAHWFSLPMGGGKGR